MKPRHLLKKLESRRDFLELVYRASPVDHYFRKSDGWHHSYLRLAYKAIKKVLRYSGNKGKFVSKLQLGSEIFNEGQFLQDICELTAASHFSEIIPAAFSYEKKVSPPTDVDFSLCISMVKDDGDYNMPHYKFDCNFNFEVKCPKIEDNGESDEFVKIHPASRFPSRELMTSIIEDISSRLSGYKRTKEAPRHDNKLKDYLLSAQVKFMDSDEKDVNTLIVCCDDELAMQDWRNYVVDSGGFFSSNPIVPKIDFNKTDVVLLTNILNRHRRIKNTTGSFINPWNFSESFSLAYINPEKIDRKWQVSGVCALFRDMTADFEEFFKNEHPPVGESIALKSILALAWFADKNADKNYFRPLN